MERITKTGLFTFLGCERLGRLEIEIIIQMKVIKLLAVYEKVEHIVPLPANLEADFDPIQLGALEELGCLEAGEEVLFILGRGGSGTDLIKHPGLKQFLVRDANLDGISKVS